MFLEKIVNSFVVLSVLLIASVAHAQERTEWKVVSVSMLKNGEYYEVELESRSHADVTVIVADLRSEHVRSLMAIKGVTRVDDLKGMEFTTNSKDAHLSLDHLIISHQLRIDGGTYKTPTLGELVREMALKVLNKPFDPTSNLDVIKIGPELFASLSGSSASSTLTNSAKKILDKAFADLGYDLVGPYDNGHPQVPTCRCKGIYEVRQTDGSNIFLISITPSTQLITRMPTMI